MRPHGIVVGGPCVDELAGLTKIDEQAFVQKLIAHPAVEGFDVAVLRRFARRDVMPFDTMIFCPGEDRVRGELGAVIRHDHRRLAAPADKHCQFACDPSPRDRGVRDRRQAFARHIIHDVENAEPQPAARPLLPGYFLPLTAPDPLDPITPDLPAIIDQQRCVSLWIRWVSRSVILCRTTKASPTPRSTCRDASSQNSFMMWWDTTTASTCSISPLIVND